MEKRKEQLREEIARKLLRRLEDALASAAPRDELISALEAAERIEVR